ncbi:MAG: AAA family ATPase [Spirochaetia bacterium]|jgi:predicted AAA+ superfamily ATPase|nr:AAA family ATPase [Spirochaetia bacterium]
MKRQVYKKLLSWKNNAYSKPLLLQGARQVGKTYIIKEFGKNEYKHTLYLNFEEDKLLNSFFTQNLIPESIIKSLELYMDTRINPQDTLIIMDEIQVSGGALNSLKYFHEKSPEYNIIAAGSLLGIVLMSEATFPVGQVNLVEMFPLSFLEFLEALGFDNFASLIKDLNYESEIIQPLHEKLLELLKLYYIIGGMPEAVTTYINTMQLETVRRRQYEILKTYTYDFAKHANAIDIPRLNLVWESIPKYLGKENKKFVFSKLKEGARGRDYEYSLVWLKAAGLIYFSHNVNKPHFPLKHYTESAFKIYYHDTGLLGAASNLPPKVLLEQNRLFVEFNGALVENFAAQELRVLGAEELYYWTNSQGKAEVDFLIESYPDIFPLEVKAGINLKSKSLQSYNDKYSPNLLIRSSLQNLKRDDKSLNIPLYALSQLNNFMS